MVRSYAPSAALPALSWAPTGKPYQLFALEEDAERRLSLLFEYVADSSGASAPTVVTLPVHSCLGTAGPDDRKLPGRIAAVARRFFADEDVTELHISWTGEALATLRRLAATVDDGSEHAAVRGVNSIMGSRVLLHDAVGEPPPKALAANYAEAVLRLVSQVAPTHPFLRHTADRPRTVADLLVEKELFLDPRARPEDLLEAVEEGGVLYNLLFGS